MAAPGKQPLIPEKLVDVPSQRLYILSLGLLCQAAKLFDFLQYVFGGADTSYTRKWLFVDFIYCATLARLRIPRLNYATSVVVLQILSLWLVDALMFGGIQINGAPWTSSVPSANSKHDALASTPGSFSFSDLISTIPGLGMIVSNADGDAHLLGQHTVRMSPISTAQLQLESQPFCLSNPTDYVLIPVLLNNSQPSSIKYSLTPLGHTESPTGDDKKALRRPKIDVVELSARDLKAIESSRAEALQLIRTSPSKANDDDEYDDDEDEDTELHEYDLAQHPYLQKSQSIAYLKVNKPGTLRLERVLHASSGVDARIAYPAEVRIAPCPTAGFVGTPAPADQVRCAGENADLDLKIHIFGVPPLSLRWHRETNGKRDPFMVEGIEGDHQQVHGHASGDRAPQEVDVPLTVSVDAIGTHVYTLESVTDGLGNYVVVRGQAADGEAMPDGSVDLKITRSMTVLRRPSVSFKKYGPGNPASLRIGSEVSLPISIRDADHMDGPWDVTVEYKPPQDADKRTKGWVKKLSAEQARKGLDLVAQDAGTYAITGIHGRYCEGDVMNPDVCPVIELPRPSAEIEWKRIHECSGDTGVAASLILHGTPPFQVYYRTQRDKEEARELVKTFQSARGELTLQPDRSGHYVYSFFALSDTNYKKVPLAGPSIDQVVHPLADVNFAHASSSGTKKKISSCAGNVVDVDVELKGTGPWNVEYQVVSAKRTETVRVPGITSAKTPLKVTIPKEIDAAGGSFNVDLVSVEDSSGCKRSVSVPGISVNVRRVKPTVKFYSKDGKRHVTTLEKERAHLPLRLTGDAPWRVKYKRRESPERILTATVSNPNGDIQVTNQGVYEIVEVTDAQCPGTILDDAPYTVEWVPRPFAKLSSGTHATFEPYNGSYILPPVCERTPDHVDLDLTGRPPFQIMYNIARPSELGGTVLVDQPTFSSIQPTTRFQLQTSEAGRVYYEVKQIGDAAYPLDKHRDAVIPRESRLLFEQEVYTRPSAQFKSTKRMSYCLNDALVPQDFVSDGVIGFEGVPPFTLDLTVKDVAASEVHKHTVQVRGKSWRIDLPDYRFKTIGPHLVTIDSVQDAAHCEQAAPDPLYQSIWIDIAESAAIVPFDRREEFCVGDISHFQLEGIPPWTIGYRINGKAHTQEATVSPFSLLQKQPGEFVVTSIAHQQQMCKASVTDLRYTVHSLPSAQVGHGKRIIQDIHEGDQAEIVFTLVGEPPFTFTYQRAEAPSGSKKGAKPGKVLETHTVTGVTTYEYSIFSALEGTWTVTFIADRYCRYPPAQDAIEKAKH